MNTLRLAVDSDSETDGSQATIAEGGSGSDVGLTASFWNPTETALESYVSSAMTVTLSAAAGTAQAADFSGTLTATTLSIPARTASASGSLAGLSITDDSVVEGPETITVSGSSTFENQSHSTTLTIVDDDADIELSVSPESVAEQAAAQQITVTASFKGTSSVLMSATDVTVTVAGAGGAMLGATCPSAGVDACTGLTDNQLTVSIPAGDTSGSETFMLKAPDEGTEETGEKLSLSGSASVGGLAVDVTSAELPIHNGGPTITLSLHEATAGEADLTGLVEDGTERTVRVKATASEEPSGSDATVTVTVGASGGTAGAPSCSGTGPSRSCTGGDYTRGADTVDITIADGDTSGTADVTLMARTDNVMEGAETIRFAGSTSAAGYRLVDSDLKILERILLTLSNSSVAEASANAAGVSATASFVGVTANALTSDTDVTLTFTAGDAAETPDFTAPNTAVTLSIPSTSTSSAAAPLTGLLINGDSIAEGAEVINIGGTADGFSVTGAGLTITDDDLGVTVEADTDSGTSGEQKNVAEGTASPDVRVRAKFTTATSNDLGEAYRVEVTAAEALPASATGGGTDFTAPGSAVEMSIPVGATSLASPWTTLSGLGIADDSIAEGAETFLITGAVATGATVTPDTLTIDDDDMEVTLTLNRTTVSEADSNAGAVRATASFAGASSSTVPSATAVTLSFTAGEGAEAADFTAPSPAATLSIPARATTSVAVALSGLGITGDDIAEDPETINIGGAAGGLTVNGASLTITDNDRGVTLEADTDSGTAALEKNLAEGDTPAVRVRAKLTSATSNALTSALTVQATVGPSSPGSAAGGGTDFTAPGGPVTVSVPAGQTVGGWVNLTGLAVTDDEIAETAETFRITGTSPAAGVTVTPDTLTIAASDTGLEITTAPGNVAESSNPYDITVTARLTAASSALASPTSVTVTVTDGDGGQASVAAACSSTNEDVCTDKTGNSFPISIPAGQTSNTGMFELTARVDTNTETGETVKVTGAATVAGVSESDSTAINVLDRGIALALASSENPVSSLDENSGTTTVRVTARLPVNAPNGGATVGLKVADSGTAALSADRVWDHKEDFRVDWPAAPGGTPAGFSTGISIAAGQQSGYVDLPIAVNDDNADEETETIVIEGSTVTIGSNSYETVAASLTITDNDDPPANIDLTILDDLTEVAEGGGPIQVRVRASFQGTAATSQTTRVPVQVGKVGDVPTGDDYQANPNTFNIEILPYDTSAAYTFALDPNDDEDVEGPETITVTGTLAGFTIGEDTLVIIDDDAPITLTFRNSSDNPVTAIGEGDTSPLTLRAAYPGTFSIGADAEISLAVGGTAGGSDFTINPSPTTLTIPARQNSAALSLTLTARDDSQAEGNETIQITGTAAGHIINPAVITITDNDRPTPTAQPPAPTSNPPAPPAGGGGGGGGAPPPATPPPAPPAAPPAAPEPPACQGRFCDEDGSVHEANIEQIAEWEITLGCSATDPTLFCPGAQITRRQMAAFLYRAVSQRWEIEPPTGIEISDVPEDAWYRTFADWVVSVGAFALDGDGNFNPGGVVTRADMAIMLIAAFPHLEAVADPPGRFVDAQNAAPEVAAALEGMFQTGVTRGCSTEPLRYCPDQPVTRAQMASFFVRAIDLADTQ